MGAQILRSRLFGIWRYFMKRRIKIGEKVVLLTANGLTPVRYREAFPGRDIIRELIEIDELEDPMETDLGIYERLAYAMSGAQDEGTDFEEWLGEFGPLDIFLASAEIMDVWNQNGVSQSEEDEESKK